MAKFVSKFTGQEIDNRLEAVSKKAGVFYYDNTNNRYLVFADAEARDEYLLDPTQTELVLGTFDAPFNYTAEINLTSAAYNAVFLGSTGNYIDFTFDIKNKQGASTGENVTVTYTFIRNAVRKTVTETRKFGDTVHFNIDKYLGEGTNTIMVGIMGQTSLAATTVAITYQVVNLTIEDGLDISKSYNLTSGSQLLEVPFTVSGYGTKVMEWYIDGEVLPFVKAEDEVVDVIATRTKYITLSNLQQGTHSLQMRAYTVVNGEKFYTDTLYRDIIVYTGVNSDVIIGVAVTIPRVYGVLGVDDSVAIYDMVQYVPYTLRFATYSPTNAANTEVTIALDGVVRGSINSSNGVENRFVLTSKTSGNKVLTLTSQGVSKEIAVVVEETDMNIQEIQSGLVLDFSADGKSNNSLDRDQWSFGNYVGTLTGFNWNNSSGWVNGRLEMNAGSSFGINYAPLSGKPTDTGKTIEIEWSTKNVTNDDAVICDLRGDNGAGILITATKVSLISADGVRIETEYKSDENVRIGFVINKASGVTNQHLSFIYANGIVSRGETWAITDSYASDKEILFTATEEAEISLKAIRIYDAALSSDNMFNNYTLYRDTIAEMMEVYDRNDVYEEGTVTFSPEKMMGRLPVMIVTGDIPTLENTSDKDTQIVVDIEYYNMQDSSRNFTMKNAAMRPQGTSSMGYPKKNFRIYTEKVANTVLYDANGNVVEDKLYAFKSGAQPVNCWCLKADYAESSGTHNTGIARLWNDALFNAQIDGEYKLRTEAQKKAVEANYPYDVRTTIDGFPILLFYRPTANDDVIFIGKYNFNNDKSTESVFGFKGIPNFDNSKMQCWEVLNNGNALALFTTADGFDSGWSEAFESRYPDTKTPYTGDLKAFCEWMSTVSEENFATEKWEHLDVYKMAAYWCYLMRHAGADQFVKNAMFTSEDGIKWYYILYDNDTINGLINTGDIRIKPTDGRQTVDESGSYVFAGHDSRLWNMLEADEEFIDIVSAVDNALYSAGISYANTIRIFDEEQADKWVERVYNQDAQYKYVGPYTEKGINNLFMLQGKRDLHRRWWLAKRFSIYDAKYVSGTYKSQAVEIKCLNGTEAGQQFTIVAGYPIDYGYGINNVPRSFGIALEVGESHTFTTEEVINLGDPLRIYGAPNIAGIDFSQMADRLAVVTIANVYDENLGTKLRKLVLGNSDLTNTEVTEISGLKQAISLEELDVQGMTKMLSLDLSNHAYFKTLKAWGSGVASVTLAKGAPVERLELPAAMRVLLLEQLPYLDANNIPLEDISNIVSMTILACPNVSNNFDFVNDWLNFKTDSYSTTTLVMDNVLWENVDAEEFMKVVALKNEGTLSLKGRVSIPNATVENVNAIRAAFGETVFLPDSEFFVEIPEALILEGPSRVVNGKSGTFVATPIPVAISEPIYFMVADGEEVDAIEDVAALDAATGVLSVYSYLAEDTTVVVGAKFLGRDGEYIYSNQITVDAAIEVRPTEINISGDDSVYYKDYEHTYTLDVTPDNVNVPYNVAWSLSDTDNVNIVSQDNGSCVIKVLNELTTSSRTYTITAVLTSVDEATVLTASKNINLEQVVRPTSLVFDDANGEIQFEGNYTYVATPNIAPINVDVTYGAPTLTGTAVTGGKVSLVSASNGTIVIAVSAESTEDLYFTIKQTAVVGGNGATIEGVRQVTLKNVVRPTSMTIEGASTISGKTYEYNAVLTPSNANVPMDYVWTISGSSSATIQSSDGGTCVVLADIPDADEAFTLSCTATSADGKTTVSATLSGTVQTKPSYIVATYNVTSTTSATRLLTSGSNFSINSVTSMEVDGVSVTPSKTYKFDTTGVHTVKFETKAIYYAFQGCSQLTSIDLSLFAGASTTSLNYTFYNCSSLTSIDLSLFAGASTTSLNYTFYNCSSLTSIEWGECTFPNVKTLLNTFYGCSKLTSIDLTPLAGSQITTLGSTFQGCSSLTSIDLTPFAGAQITNLSNTFYNCSKLTSVDLTPLTGAPITTLQSTFQGCSSLTSIDLTPFAGAQITNLSNTFYNCSKLTSVDLTPLAGSQITNFGSTFHGCGYVKTLIFPWITAPTAAYNSFGNGGSTYVGYYTRLTGENKFLVPYGSTGYDSGYWLDPLQNAEKCGFTLKYTYEPTECTSLTITADDVSGRDTSTTIHWTAITNGVDGLTDETLTGVEVTGTATSEEFPQNSSYTDTVERTISYTYIGVTATTTITQGVWIDQSYTLNLNDGQWELTTAVANPDSTIYDGVYQSVKSKGVSNGYDTMYIDIVGYVTFKFYVRSYAESNYDYVMVSQLDQTITGSTAYTSTLVKAHTRGNSKSGTAISDYTLVEFTGIDGGGHRITVVYRKDSGGNSGDDRGYVLIPKEQE